MTTPATTPADGVTDEQLDAALDAFNVFPCPMNGSVVRFPHPDQMRAAIAAVLATPSPGKADAEDAARYRWLREQNWNGSELCVVRHPKKSVKLGYECTSGQRLDDRIDAASQQERDHG